MIRLISLSFPQSEQRLRRGRFGETVKAYLHVEHALLLWLLLLGDLE